MARFHYKMQNILEVKYKLETQAKTAFAQAAAALREEEEKLENLNQRRAAYEREARGLLEDRLEVAKIQECQRAIVVMRGVIRSQTVNVRVAQRNLESARLRLNEVMKDRKTHEKLKEREFEEFLREEERAESKAIDELVSFTFGNKLRD